MRAFVLFLSLACSSPVVDFEAPPQSQPTIASSPLPSSASLPAQSAPEEGHWYAGDLHCHVSPPDPSDDVSVGPKEIARLAKERGLDFVFVVPHLWTGSWKKERKQFLAAYDALVKVARATPDVTLIPGVEFGVPKLGHFGVSDLDLRQIQKREDFLEAANEAGAFIVLNHPYALPLKIAGFKTSHFDMSYRPWTGGKPGFSGFDAVESWNAPLSLGNLLSTPTGKTAEEETLLKAEQWARTQKKKLTLVGGSDNHATLLLATTWVYAKDKQEASLLEALRAGRTCVGGPEAQSFTARGDLDAKPVGIGGNVRAQKQVVLQFFGEARVFVDGVDQGLHKDQFIAQSDSSPHTFRVVMGRSRSGFIYANFE